MSHHEFLEQRQYRPIAKNTHRFYSKGAVFIGINRAGTKTLIIRKNRNLPDHPDSRYHVVYKGSYPWDDLAFATALFRHLRLDHVPDGQFNYDEEITDSSTLFKF